MNLYVTMSYVLSAFQLSVTRCVFSLNWLERVLFLGLCLSWSCALLSMAAIYSLGHRVRWVPAVSGLGRDALQGTRARRALTALRPCAHPGAIPDGLSLPMVFAGPFGGRKKKGSEKQAARPTAATLPREARVSARGTGCPEWPIAPEVGAPGTGGGFASQAAGPLAGLHVLPRLPHGSLLSLCVWGRWGSVGPSRPLGTRP